MTIVQTLNVDSIVLIFYVRGNTNIVGLLDRNYSNHLYLFYFHIMKKTNITICGHKILYNRTTYCLLYFSITVFILDLSIIIWIRSIVRIEEKMARDEHRNACIYLLYDFSKHKSDMYRPYNILLQHQNYYIKRKEDVKV